MGLDIHIGVDNYDEVYSIDYHTDDNFNKHSLSRTFCNFMCRRDVISGEAELDQIGHITAVDISPLYDMSSYPEEEGMEFILEITDTEAEKQQILARVAANREKVAGNIDKVLCLLDTLIGKLGNIDNLPELLAPTDFDTLSNEVYFSDFRQDKGEGYIGNNFGQDLRNFKRFLEYAKSRGTSSVWFGFG